MKCKFLALTPNPFPVVKGCVCLVGFASLQSPWAYTPGIYAGAECGAAVPPTKDAYSNSDTVASLRIDPYD